MIPLGVAGATHFALKKVMPISLCSMINISGGDDAGDTERRYGT